MFIIDENDKVIGHPDVQRLGLDMKGWVGTDANGYNFGPDMLSATGEGKWVSYMFRNPESGSLGSDHSGTLLGTLRERAVPELPEVSVPYVRGDLTIAYPGVRRQCPGTPPTSTKPITGCHPARQGQVRLPVADDGVGLLDGYAEHGGGFDGMWTYAEQMGRRLIVESGERGGGTIIVEHLDRYTSSD